jgi:PKD repeat protein
MTKNPFLFISIASILFACKKESVSTPDPTASFSVVQYNGFSVRYGDTVFIIGTHDALVLHNQSQHADSIAWHLGNGRFSSANDVQLTYDSAGTFQVSLTAYGKNGQSDRSPALPIVVKDRLLKGFSINNVDINKFSPSQNGLPVFSRINIWMELKLSRSQNDAFTANGDILAPVIYQSPVFTNIDSGFHASLTFTIPQTDKIPIDYPVNNSSYYAGGRGLIINLYGQDNTGTYLLSSSAWSGIGISASNGSNPAKVSSYDLLTPVAGSPTSVTLHCAFQ